MRGVPIASLQPITLENGLSGFVGRLGGGGIVAVCGPEKKLILIVTTYDKASRLLAESADRSECSDSDEY